jgi:aldose 1-epimerase
MRYNCGVSPPAGHVTRRMEAEAASGRFRGEPAVILRAGELQATFLPAVGMTGVSLRVRGREHLALPGGVAHVRAGGTGGLPLLAPWANRLAGRRYRVGATSVDLSGLALGTDDNGLPIHGFLAGAGGWRVDGCDARRGSARLRASIDVDAPAFPFPHRVEVVVVARDGELDIRTTVIPTARRRVPVAFGWHPYLRLPGPPRREWQLRMPRRRHLALDGLGIPTGASTVEPAEALPIGRRTFDDLYALGRDRRLAFETDDAMVELRCDSAYPFAQVWVPAGAGHGALEPMVAPTNALVDGTAPHVAPGDSFSARFVLAVR